MAAELIIAPEAEQDVADAYAWYESRRSGLGEEILTCVDARIEAIRRTPDLHPIVHENNHRGLVRRFPYAVLVVGQFPVWPPYVHLGRRTLARLSVLM